MVSFNICLLNMVIMSGITISAFQRSVHSRLFGEVKDDQQTFFLEGQVIITAIAAILFGIISIRIIAVGRNHADDSNPYQQVNESL